MKDLFSQQADLYSKYRPVYPAELYKFLFRYVQGRESALDCATGNGQVARVLADHFQKVCAIDISNSQLSHAVQKSNIEYSVSRSEKTPFADNSFDLITVAQAFHWFDGPAFWKEATRVSRPGAIVAIWVYDISSGKSPLEAILRRWNFDALGPYWEAERQHIYSFYRDLSFEFERIPAPEFQINVDWSREELIGHLGTWSALQKMKQQVGDEPFRHVVEEIKSVWDNGDRKRFTFPLVLHLGTVRK